MRIVIGILLLAACGEPEPYLIKSTEHEIKDSIGNYNARLQGAWYVPGNPARAYEYIDGTVNEKGLVISRYELPSLHKLVIHHRENADTLTLHFKADTLLLNNAIYTRTP